MKRFNGLWRSHEDNTLRRLLARPLEEFGLQDDTSEDEVLKRQLEVIDSMSQKGMSSSS